MSDLVPEPAGERSRSGPAAARTAGHRRSMAGLGVGKLSLAVVPLLASVLALAACARGSAPPASKVDFVVPDAVGSFDQIQAAGMDLPADARGHLAPLVAARTFTAPGPPSSYGLDHPVTTLTYRRLGSVVLTVDVGSANFDGHGFYVQRRGSPIVYLVLRDELVPALRAVGLAPPPVADTAAGP